MSDIVYEGKRYWTIGRIANKGETIIIVDGYADEEYKNGDIGTVVDDYAPYRVKFRNFTSLVDNCEYEVLEPIESEECCVTESQASPAVIDMLANLARRLLEVERELLEYKALGIRDHLREGNNVLDNRVTSLERQLASTQRNVETWAEQTESNTQDIAMLDERTYPKEEEITPDESIPQYWAEMLVKFYERRDR